MNKETLRNLRAAQLAANDLVGIVRAKREAFEESIAADVAVAKIATDTLDGVVKTAKAEALAEFLETGSKKLEGGLGIRTKTVLVYDVSEAIAFAERNPELGLLALDVRAFENAASGLKLDFVEVKEEATVTIPKEVKP